MYMDQRYNFYNFEASFKEYLLAGNIQPISIKNYLSDFRHFAGWLTLVIASDSEAISNRIVSSPSAPRDDITPFITSNRITEYKSYLLENKIPHKTINRRLSTVRKFCSFCISQGWMKENPGRQIQNAGVKTPSPNDENQILTQFEQSLIKENLNQSIIKSFLDDIREFLAV